MTAVVFWSRVHGVGKGLVGETMCQLYGEQNYQEICTRDLYSQFNDWCACRQFIMGTEICTGSARGERKRETADYVKSLITQPRIRVNTKFLPQYNVPDCGNYYFTSNHPDARASKSPSHSARQL